MRTLLALTLLISTACTGQVGPGVSTGESDAGTKDPHPPGPLTQPADAGPTSSRPDANVPPPKPDAAPPKPDAAPPVDPPPADEIVAYLDIHAMDIWGQYLGDDATLVVSQDEAEVSREGFPVSRVPLTRAGDTLIELSAPEHDPLEVLIHFDGTADSDAVTIAYNGGEARAGVLLNHERAAKPVHNLYLGLRHRWFAATGRPARRGNDLRFLMDGEEAWSAVYRDLTLARRSILLASWFFQSDFELVRDWATHATATADQRRPYTMLSILEGSPALKRVLIGEFYKQDGLLSWVSSDAAVRNHGAVTGDNFEFMGQANPTSGTFTFGLDPLSFGERVHAMHSVDAARAFDDDPDIFADVPGHAVDLTHWPVSVDVQAASMHQKFIVIDGSLAYVGGMNVKSTDWDSSQHLPYDFRRMEFGSTTSARLDVVAKSDLPDLGPRKDYMVRIEGPAAQDAAAVFKRRWDWARDEGVEYAENTTSFTVDTAVPERGGLQAQITDTLPDPLWEHSIVESWLNAVGNAERYIYIEDQYFRAPILNDAIMARMEQVPDLRLVVITKPMAEWTDPGCYWTYRAHAAFKTRFPDRYKLLQLRAFDVAPRLGVDETKGVFLDMDTHSKILIVDDKFLSVGSCNKNNRGLVYEGEMNVAVLDEGWVGDARRRIFANLMPGLAATDDVDVWWGQLTSVEQWNDYVRANWEAEGDDLNLNGAALPDKYIPFGFVYSMDFPDASSCVIEDIGEDMT